MPQKNDLERKAIQLMFEAGPEGLLQSDMWKSLGVTSREGSRLALKFEEKGAIERSKVLNKGRWTYKLFTKMKLVTIKSIKSCPCIVCEALNKCFDGGQISPLTCQLLTQWMDPIPVEQDV
ncbi:MAG: transcriptional regulator [Candidatus Bathyarchaeota archaeon]|nr:transcriptional regulator [Candidatus Bathyarchaeota archaeon]